MKHELLDIIAIMVGWLLKLLRLVVIWLVGLMATGILVEVLIQGIGPLPMAIFTGLIVFTLLRWKNRAKPEALVWGEKMLQKLYACLRMSDFEQGMVEVGVKCHALFGLSMVLSELISPWLGTALLLGVAVLVTLESWCPQMNLRGHETLLVRLVLLAFLVMGTALQIHLIPKGVPVYGVVLSTMAAGLALYAGRTYGPVLAAKMENKTFHFWMLCALLDAVLCIWNMTKSWGNLLFVPGTHICLEVINLLLPLTVLELCSLTFVPFRKRLCGIFLELVKSVVLWGYSSKANAIFVFLLTAVSLILALPEKKFPKISAPTMFGAGVLAAIAWKNLKIPELLNGKSELYLLRGWFHRLLVLSYSSSERYPMASYQPHQHDQILSAAIFLGRDFALAFLFLMAVLILAAMLAAGKNPRRAELSTVICSAFAIQTVMHVLSCTGALNIYFVMDLPWLSPVGLDGTLARCGCLFLGGILAADWKELQPKTPVLLLPEHLEKEDVCNGKQ